MFNECIYGQNDYTCFNWFFKTSYSLQFLVGFDKRAATTQGSKWVRWWIFCGILSSGLGEEAHVGERERVSYPFCMARIGVASLSLCLFLFFRNRNSKNKNIFNFTAGSVIICSVVIDYNFEPWAWLFMSLNLSDWNRSD